MSEWRVLCLANTLFTYLLTYLQCLLVSERRHHRALFFDGSHVARELRDHTKFRAVLNDFVISRIATAGSDCQTCADDQRRR